MTAILATTGCHSGHLSRNPQRLQPVLNMDAGSQSGMTESYPFTLSVAAVLRRVEGWEQSLLFETPFTGSLTGHKLPANWLESDNIGDYL